MAEGLTRTEDGRFVKGVSGNPSGRPPSKKNRITELTQDLEIALREHIRPDQVKGIIDEMVKLAQEGSVGAAKLILDKVLPSARPVEDTEEGRGALVIRVENLTLRGESPNQEKPVQGHTLEQES